MVTQYHSHALQRNFIALIDTHPAWIWAIFRMSESSDGSDNKPARGELAGNVGEPIKLTDLTLAGVSAEAARGGQSIKLWTRLSLTSDDRHFYRIVESFAAHIEHMVRQVGHHVSLTRPGLILLVIHPDNTGELWLDAAAVSLNVLTKRPIVAGTLITREPRRQISVIPAAPPFAVRD